MDLQHNLAKKIMYLLVDEEHILEDGVIVTYGIEILINEFSKLIIGLLIGWKYGIFMDVVFMEIYLIMLRRLAGGKHFKSNIVCFVVSILTIDGIPLIANSINWCSSKIIFILIILEAIALMFLVPLYEWKPNKKEKIEAKIYVVSLYLLFIVISILFLKATYMYIVVLFTLIEIISLIRNIS